MLRNSPTRVSNTTVAYHLWLLGFLTQKQGSVSKLYQCTGTQCCLLITSLPVWWHHSLHLAFCNMVGFHCRAHVLGRTVRCIPCSDIASSFDKGAWKSVFLFFFSWNCPQAIIRTKKQKCECVFIKTESHQKPKPLNTRKGFQKRLSRGGFRRQRERTPETGDPTAISIGCGEAKTLTESTRLCGNASWPGTWPWHLPSSNLP